MRNTILSKDDFVRLLEAVKTAYCALNNLDKCGLTYSDDGPLIGLVDKVVDFLSIAMGDNDEYPLVHDFCWSGNFGANPINIEINDEVRAIDTIEGLYDTLKETTRWE